MSAHSCERCKDSRIIKVWHDMEGPCPDCKPSEGAVSDEQLRDLRHRYQHDFQMSAKYPSSDEVAKVCDELLTARATIERQAGEYAAALESIRAEMLDAERKHGERIRSLEAELDGAKLNERRYLWLREHGSKLIRMGSGAFSYEIPSAENLDTAIDAAMAEAKS